MPDEFADQVQARLEAVELGTGVGEEEGDPRSGVAAAVGVASPAVLIVLRVPPAWAADDERLRWHRHAVDHLARFGIAAIALPEGVAVEAIRAAVVEPTDRHAHAIGKDDIRAAFRALMRDEYHAGVRADRPYYR